MPPERRTILFSGRVQGVGFRATALNLAHDLDLRGTIRNLDNGDVELLAEGPPEAFDTLISKLREHFRSFIRNIEQSRSPGTGTLPPGLHVDF